MNSSTNGAGTTTTEEQSYREALISPQELTECDKLDLHLSGAIQGDDIANLIVIGFPDLHIQAVDARIDRVPFLVRQTTSKSTSTATQQADDDVVGEAAASAAAMVGSKLDAWIPLPLLQKVIDIIKNMKQTHTKRDFSFFHNNTVGTAATATTTATTTGGGGSGAFFSLTISTATVDYSVISIEVEEFDGNVASDSFNSTLVFLTRVTELYGKGESAAKSAADVLFDLLPKYDRAMLYRFNDDLSGEIIHEVKRSHITSSYLGLTFPQSDIPQSSRMLYIKNVLRYIHNANATDVPIVVDGPQQVDLTQVRARSCHKAHLIYMRNMGVVCSMSLAIVVEGELWGLLAFHGYGDPFKPTLNQRVACETIASIVSARVEALVKKTQSLRVVRMGEILVKWRTGDDAMANLEALGDDLLQVLGANVLAVNVDTASSSTDSSTASASSESKLTPGTVVVGEPALAPGKEFWKKMKMICTSPGFCHKSTRRSVKEMGITETDCPTPGFVYFSSSQLQIMLGRAWMGRDVVWAGTPDAPKLRLDGILNPRKSFEAQREKARLVCRAWSPADLEMIQFLQDRVVTEQSHSWMMSLTKSNLEEANLHFFNALARSEDNSDFFAHMSHELRTPFHAVISSLTIIEDSLAEMSRDDIAELIRTAISSGNHMIHLLNDILLRSKNKYLSTENSPHQVVFKEFAMETVSSMKNLAQSAHVPFSFEVQPSDRDIGVTLDKTKVTQIVTNITNNAIKFCGPTGVVSVKFHLVDCLDDAMTDWESVAQKYDATVCLVTEGGAIDSVDKVRSTVLARHVQTKDGKWLSFSVEDTGSGMKANEIAAMFEPYQQGSAKTGTTMRGTGLGLFICVSLCFRLGGHIICSSTAGKGTIFNVGLPVTLCDSSQAVDTNESKFKTDIIPMTGPILIVDDNEINVKVLRRQISMLLKKQGMDIELLTALGGREALEIFSKRLPSLIILDYHMPDGWDGLRTTIRIREMEIERALRPSYIVSYTADCTEKAEVLLLEAGSNEIMTKPPVKDYVKNLICRLQLRTLTEAFKTVFH